MPTSVDKFTSRIAGRVQGAPSETIRQALIDATSEFCEKSRIWNEIQDAQIVVNGVSDYEVDLPSRAKPLSIETVWCGQRPLRAVTMGQLQTLLPDWQTAVGTEPLYYNSAFDWNTFRVYPMPLDVVGAQLRIKGSFQPSEDADTLPDFLWERWRTALTAGALALLQTQFGKAWFNLQQADINRTIFTSQIGDATIARMREGASNHMTVTPRAFGSRP